MAEKKVRPAAAAPDVGADALSDGDTATAAIAKLREMKDGPFFLAVGFQKPHLPFIAPKLYWERFDRASFPVPTHRTPPIATPRDAFHGPGELLSYNVEKDALNEGEVRELIHGYYASTAYVDAQAGRILAELERLGLADNTIIVFWSDHGYQLGEHGECPRASVVLVAMARVKDLAEARGSVAVGPEVLGKRDGVGELGAKNVPRSWIPIDSGRMPVRRDLREGAQTACWQYARSKRSPLAASRSMFGVRASLSP